MAGAGRAGVDHAPGEGVKYRAHALDAGGLTADHDVERSLPGVLGRAAERRVDERDAFGRQLLGKARRDRGLGSRAVDDEEGLSGRGEPVGPVDQRFDLRAAGDAEDDDVAGLRQLAGARGLARTPALQVLDGLAPAVAEHGQRPALLDDVLCHAMAHEAHTGKADPFLAQDQPPCPRWMTATLNHRPNACTASAKGGPLTMYEPGGGQTTLAISR